jgi:shikimate kinase
MIDRVARGGARPRLGEDPTQSLRDLYLTRQLLYASVASLVLDVDDLSPEEVVARLIAETGFSEEE